MDNRKLNKQMIFFLIVYIHLVTSESSDEAKAGAPPSLPPPPRHDPEPLTPSLPYSSLNFCPAAHRISGLFDDNSTTLVPVTPPRPPLPPPLPDNRDLHSVMGDQQSGEATLADIIALAISTSSKDERLARLQIILIPTALWVGFVAIFRNGILLRNMFPRSAQLLGPLGIALAVMSFNRLIAFILPLEFRWIPAVCMWLSVPLIIAGWQGQSGPI